MATGEHTTRVNFPRVRAWLGDTAVRRAVIIFIVLRLFLSLWAVAATSAVPVPTEPDETLRPYLGAPQFSDGWQGRLLGPWQRFDTLRYLRIVREGYTAQESVFPPLYPLAVRGLSVLLGGNPEARLIAAILVSNVALLGLLILLHKVAEAELGAEHAGRTLVYFALYPTAFFLFAPYTESLFLLLALGSLWAGRNGRFRTAGLLGFLAALTRLTGWILVIPLAYEYWRHHRSQLTDYRLPITDYRLPVTDYRLRLPALATLLPGLGLALFLAWRWWAGFPPLGDVYTQFWYQTTGIPGRDVVTAVGTLFFGGAARANEIISLAFDFASTVLITVTTILAFRKLNATWGLYAAMLLFFMLLPTSPVKPLYSFSRYTLAFIPTFLLLGRWGKRPIIHRLILYSSVALYLFFSGQFFIWGWVA